MTDAPRHRFFAEDVSGDAIELSEDEVRHARDVLRLTGGETVEVFDGAGGAVVGTFATSSAPNSPRRKAGVGGPNPPLPRGATRDEQQGGTHEQRSFHPTPTPDGPRRKAGVRASVCVVERRQTERPDPTIELAFAVPKGNRLDWLLEKAAELGVARLVPVAFERSVVRPDLSEHARQRWRGILIAAGKQCGSDWLPEIAPPAVLADYLAGVHCGIRLLGDAREGVSVPEALGIRNPSSPGPSDHPLPSRERGIRILVGPEGGLTEEERGAARAAGFVPVRIGWTVLRVETAAVALLAAVVACAVPSHGT